MIGPRHTFLIKEEFRNSSAAALPRSRFGLVGKFDQGEEVEKCFGKIQNRKRLL
jgi:hypothetical protein